MNACLSVFLYYTDHPVSWAEMNSCEEQVKEVQGKKKESTNTRPSVFALVLSLLQRLSYMGGSHSTNKLNAATFSVDIEGFLVMSCRGISSTEAKRKWVGTLSSPQMEVQLLLKASMSDR